MPVGRLTDRQLVLCTGLLTIALVVVSALLTVPGGGAAGPTSLSAAAAGGKAAYDTLAALGYRIERSYEPMASLRVDPASTTLLITGPLEPSSQDRRALTRFLEAGGEVLVVGAQGAAFLEVKGARPAPPMPALPNLHRVMAASPVSVGVTEITMRGDAGTPAFGPRYVSVFAVNDERPLVATASMGAGRATWWAAPTPLTNADVSHADNLQLLLNIAGAPGGRRVLWDEHYHGTSRSLWSYLARTPLPWAGAQVGLLALAAFAAFSRRSGPVRARASPPRTSPLEFIEMLGEMYRRAGARPAAVATARARLVRAATSSCGIPHDAPDGVIARAIASRTSASAAEIETVLADARRATETADVDRATALGLAGRLQQLTEHVRGDTTRPRT